MSKAVLQTNEINVAPSSALIPKAINQSIHEAIHENNRTAGTRAQRALQAWIRRAGEGACRNVHNGATDARRATLSLRYGGFWSTPHKGDFGNGSKESCNARQAQGKVSLLTALGRLFTITRVAQATNGFDSSEVYRRTAPQSLRFFCARVMAGCAWGAYSPAGFLYSGLSTCAQLATNCLTALVVSSRKSVRELYHV